ncbi:MAG: hypothetical protein CME64_06845 [Halobacteriovoraceae bacterium]|nr:hypothetical protein [Halobacteriovoraceae bacterium]
MISYFNFNTKYNCLHFFTNHAKTQILHKKYKNRQPAENTYPRKCKFFSLQLGYLKSQLAHSNPLKPTQPKRAAFDLKIGKLMAVRIRYDLFVHTALSST